MAWLADWLKQIIAIILLAGIVELLMPSNSYQRYVRLVIGLFILLALLSPILSLMQGEFGPRLEAGIQDWQVSASRQVAGGDRSLMDVQNQGAKLQEQQLDQAASLAAVKLAEEMAGEISRRSGVQPPQVEVALEADSRSGYWRISGVHVALRESEGGEDSSQSATIQPPDPVEPITVEVWLGEQPTEPDQPKSREAGEHWQQVVRTVLAEGWGVDPELVQVRQLGGD